MAEIHKLNIANNEHLEKIKQLGIIMGLIIICIEKAPSKVEEENKESGNKELAMKKFNEFKTKFAEKYNACKENYDSLFGNIKKGKLKKLINYIVEDYSFRGYYLEDAGATIIALGVKWNQRILALDLGTTIFVLAYLDSCGIGDSGVGELCAVIKTHKSLAKLSLGIFMIN